MVAPAGPMYQAGTLSGNPLAMAAGLEDVAAFPEPVGRILDERTRPNGLTISRVSVPLGVIGIIYESRPNVTADAGGLCVKSGNAAILRGGSESLHSATAIAALESLGVEQPGRRLAVVRGLDRVSLLVKNLLPGYRPNIPPTPPAWIPRSCPACIRVTPEARPWSRLSAHSGWPAVPTFGCRGCRSRKPR